MEAYDDEIKIAATSEEVAEFMSPPFTTYSSPRIPAPAHSLEILSLHQARLRSRLVDIRFFERECFICGYLNVYRLAIERLRFTYTFKTVSACD
jgi:hypothetical protein